MDSLTGILAVASLMTSAAGIRLAIRLALRTGMLDMPNERSSHTRPTPRTGGIPMAAAASLAFAGWVFLPGGPAPGGMLSRTLLFALAMSCLGFCDDLYDLSPLFRLFVQLAAACLFLQGAIRLPGALSWEGMIAPAAVGFFTLWVVWILNLYNFMDGIDGLAGGEAVLISSFFFVMFTDRGEPAWAAANLFIAVAAAGFLVYNWSPARVFMGDAGSAFLGAFYGMQSVAAWLDTGIPFPVLVLPLSNFIMDTAATLLRRIGRGEKWYAAHRSHYYQRMTALGMTHAAVTKIELFAAALSCAAAAVYAGSGPFVRAAVIVLVVGALAAAGIRVAARERSGQGKEVKKSFL